MTALTPERLDEIEERLSANYMKRASSMTMEKLDVIELIAAARANAKLVEALNPFAAEADAQDKRNPHADRANITVGQFTIGQCRRARAALEAAGVKP